MANNEFGDFQTNPKLSAKVVDLLAAVTGAPATIVEPTCGRGNLIKATFDAFPDATVHGLEINAGYVAELERKFQFQSKFVLHSADYFQFDWTGLVSRMAKPVWVIGNPPWVTNSQLMKLDSTNLPKKSPQANLSGFEAQTGKSNFDISESMIRDWFGWCSACDGSLAVICKTSVARKLLQWWWKSDQMSPSARMYHIDAKAEFDVTVSACVLVCSFAGKPGQKVCEVFAAPDAEAPVTRFGLVDGILVSDADGFQRGRELIGDAQPRWRSGLKHDASAVLELQQFNGIFRNKTGNTVHIEPEFVFPLMKGSDLGSKRENTKVRAIIVPQRHVGDSTDRIAQSAPKTWAYLQSHRAAFESRKSIIYKKGGNFSIFGIGDYSFKPWKIAIGALYKNLNFRLVGPLNGRPVMFDDTVYFIGFDTYEDASKYFVQLQSADVQNLIKSMIFWDDMRPVKTEILNRVNLAGNLFRIAA
jgi:hypothetical protein